jgi:hypothetical protein
LIFVRHGESVHTVEGTVGGPDSCQGLTTTVLVGHSETVSASFHALGMLPLYRSFDLLIAAGSITEWLTDGDPTSYPPPRWALARCAETPG